MRHSIIGLSLVLALPIEAWGQVEESSAVSKELQWRTLAGTVRLNGTVKNGHCCRGTGAIIARDGDSTYVLTAAHCVRDTTNLEVEYFEKASYSLRGHASERAVLVAADDASDIALLKVSKSMQPPHIIPICPADELPKPGDIAWNIGCGSGNPPYCTIGTFAGEDSLGLRTDYPGIGGFSGGPVLDNKGRLIGIWTGTRNKAGYAVSSDLMYQILDDNKLGPLTQAGRPFARLSFRFVEYVMLAVCFVVLLCRFLHDERLSEIFGESVCGDGFPWWALIAHLLGAGGMIILFTSFIRVPFTVFSIGRLVVIVWGICYGPLVLSAVFTEGFVPRPAWWPMAVLYAKASCISVAVAILCSRGPLQSFWWVALGIPVVTALAVLASLLDRWQRGVA